MAAWRRSGGGEAISGIRGMKDGERRVRTTGRAQTHKRHRHRDGRSRPRASNALVHNASHRGALSLALRISRSENAGGWQAHNKHSSGINIMARVAARSAPRRARRAAWRIA